MFKNQKYLKFRKEQKKLKKQKNNIIFNFIKNIKKNKIHNLIIYNSLKKKCILYKLTNLCLFTSQYKRIFNNYKMSRHEIHKNLSKNNILNLLKLSW